MADEEKASGPQTLTVGQAAALLGKSERYVQNLVQYGFIERTKRGEYGLVAVVRGAIAYQDDQIEKANKSAAAARATDARTREIELRISERTRELIPLEDAKGVVAEVVQATRAEFAGLPVRFTRDTRERRRLEREIDEGFRRLAIKARERSAALGSGELDLDTGDQMQPSGMGSGEPDLS